MAGLIRHGVTEAVVSEAEVQISGWVTLRIKANRYTRSFIVAGQLGDVVVNVWNYRIGGDFIVIKGTVEAVQYASRSFTYAGELNNVTAAIGPGSVQRLVLHTPHPTREP